MYVITVHQTLPNYVNLYSCTRTNTARGPAIEARHLLICTGTCVWQPNLSRNMPTCMNAHITRHCKPTSSDDQHLWVSVRVLVSARTYQSANNIFFSQQTSTNQIYQSKNQPTNIPIVSMQCKRLLLVASNWNFCRCLLPGRNFTWIPNLAILHFCLAWPHDGIDWSRLNSSTPFHLLPYKNI